MMKGIQTLAFLSLVLLFAGSSFGQIYMDGDSTDWQNEPILINWIDNVDALFPEDVGAAVTDAVDIKHVRAKIVGNVIYVFFRFWGDPAWPNEDTGEHEGTPVTRARGYYHLLLDLDNDVTTGWNTFHYEEHFTTVGYQYFLKSTDM